MQSQRAACHHHFGERGAWEAGIGFDVNRDSRPCFHQPEDFLCYFTETHEFEIASS